MSDADGRRRGADEALQRADAVRSVLAEHRAAGDRQRRLADEALRALTDAGLFRAWVPRRFGGLEYDLRTIVDSTTALATADPSAAWLVMILSCGDWLTGLFPQRAQHDVFGDDPDTRVCQVLTPHSTARRVDGGWVAGGRWGPASGCLHAQWAMLGIRLPEHDGRPAGSAYGLVPMRELTIKDTWFTLGMRATGSNLLVGEDLFVPDHRILPVGPAIEGRYAREDEENVRYRAALVPTLSTHLIAPFVGMATAALDYVVGESGRRGISFTNYERMTDSTAFQMAVAEAATRADVARMIAYQCASTVDSHARAGTYPSYVERARIRQHASHAVQQCREAVDLLVSAYGASAMADSNPLQGLLRDIHTGSRHAIASTLGNPELFGRAMLGVRPNITELI
ncbi:acyl-CoA dehydrogenase [Saccharopolyspora erythraea]|uniref:acyl-CoA dehydrogenase family protein n=1 Tax=Saccharopolyspora erythraea TaxID=1836 RepID=UPI001BAC7348|nr:acyl-CoA dehydrogenase family protein [Saccharopolyspora erythraea]QUH03030.1 acyl-CoA dehydrogenase [Saccharopolyspora erythraea]